MVRDQPPVSLFAAVEMAARGLRPGRGREGGAGGGTGGAGGSGGRGNRPRGAESWEFSVYLLEKMTMRFQLLLSG